MNILDYIIINQQLIFSSRGLTFYELKFTLQGGQSLNIAAGGETVTMMNEVTEKFDIQI